MKRAVLAIVLALAASWAFAVERVLDFHSEIRIAPNGTLTVTEMITVQAEGREIRRGIFRDFPTDYRDRHGNRVSVPLEVLSVARDGRPEPYALERLANGTRIRIGSANLFLQPGAHEYRIVYRTARQIGFFERHDELYWNVNGNGWPFAFERMSAEVLFAQPVPAGDIHAEAYTGPQGARGRNYQAFVRHGSAAFRITRALGPREGLTVVVAFPKGVVAPPTALERAGGFLRDNRGLAVGTGAALLFIAYLLYAWWRVGRDPPAGPAFPRYEAPRGLGPAGVRYVDRKGYDDRCFAAALVGLASRGVVKIRQDGDDYEVQRTGRTAALTPAEAELMKRMFAEGARFAFGRDHDPRVHIARGQFAAALGLQVGRQLHTWNAGASFLGLLLGVAAVGLMGILAAPAWLTASAAAAMAATWWLFAFKLIPAYSVAGRKVQDHIDGLRQYLCIAEKDDLARRQAPPQTAAEFSKFLPYALALGVEKTWADRFAATLGAAAVAAAVAEFYSSTSGDAFSAEGFAGALSGIADTVSAASTPPGSDSGSSDSGGGGGSSGGGGGGGGGGGW